MRWEYMKCSFVHSTIFIYMCVCKFACYFCVVVVGFLSILLSFLPTLINLSLLFDKIYTNKWKIYSFVHMFGRTNGQIYICSMFGIHSIDMLFNVAIFCASLSSPRSRKWKRYKKIKEIFNNLQRIFSYTIN